jgi:hypothetical protein
MILVPSQGPEDWKRLMTEPDLHWKTGHSTTSLAHCWEDAKGDFPACVSAVFKGSGLPLFEVTEPLLIIPEYKVSLPGETAASQNDIFVLVKGAGQLVTIMVEGKVSEPFGPLVSEWIEDPSIGKVKFLTYLCRELGLEADDVMGVRYQLLHRAASAIIEARRFNTDAALMLVHSFSPSLEGFEDYDRFAALFGLEAKAGFIHHAVQNDDVDLFISWVTGDDRFLRKGPALAGQTQATSKTLPGEVIEGVVTARKCDCCGHHEIGITTPDGAYIALKPGMKTTISSESS